jgi:hypothetical protein
LVKFTLVTVLAVLGTGGWGKLVGWRRMEGGEIRGSNPCAAHGLKEHGSTFLLGVGWGRAGKKLDGALDGFSSLGGCR